ncbi:MAG TPA: efflux RND transporter periplasmic adaptor subunit [Verrucomicrobiae bacterium]|nr:efflux RND transporter periplasmic adaptor subunit [Verrucomicrobiae bacterium]
MVLAACGGGRTAAENGADAPIAPVVKVTRQNLSDTLNIASEFLPFQEIDVYAKVSGYIRQLNVDWGTHVRQGDILAILEVPELEQQVQVDEASMKRSESDLEGAREELNRAQSAYTVAHLTYTRLANVQKSHPELVAQEEIDVAQGKDLEASASYSGAKDALAAAEQALAAAKSALQKDRALFDYTRIIAPFDGVVTQIDAYKGALLPAGTSSDKGNLALCHLSQNNLLRLVIPVPERAVPGIRIGQSVEVDVSALHRSFDGKIIRFSDQIDMETRTMHTEVQVPNPTFTLVPGMYASVKLPLHTATNTLTLPVQAIRNSGQNRGSVLVVGADGKIERRDIALGLEGANSVEILSGLQEGDLVVFGEQSQFQPGEIVKPKLIQPSEVE